MLYLLLVIPVILVIAFFYANRKQARATVVDAPPEPDVDLTYRPPAPREDSKPDELLEKPRDPALAQLSKSDLVMAVLSECYDPRFR